VSAANASPIFHSFCARSVNFVMNSSAILSKRKMRLTARHAWPALKKRPIAAAAVARRTSASSATMSASLPPSSSVTRVTFFDASAMIRLPVAV